MQKLKKGRNIKLSDQRNSISLVCPYWAECGSHADVDSLEQTLCAEAKTLISTWKENQTSKIKKRNSKTVLRQLNLHLLPFPFSPS
ncbi:hypothetical protein RJT34_06076 [Clitoria ternatea]|uniref:Uncharacterized protein n=1 Tax=Clitoria ternatea TaxID=43366 RepID=A0AAN9K3D7_CLITE